MNNSEHNNNNIDILLVEDNPADARLTFEALKDGKLANYKNIHHVSDGERAIKYLSQEAPFEDAVMPNLVLLDINMPKVNGIEVLKFIRGNKMLETLPVVMLTTSQSEEDIVKSYTFHANCYVSKPVDFQSFVQVVSKIEQFWFSVVHLPPSTEA